MLRSSQKICLLRQCRYATKAEKAMGIDRKVPPKIYQTAQSIAARGFLRSRKSYSPPEKVAERVLDIYRRLGNTHKPFTLENLQHKFEILDCCAKEFDHVLPSSMIHEIKTVDHIVQFYEMEWNMETPYDKLKNMDCPPNLHIQSDYHRYLPETDTKFGGQTAFNRSSTLVTGLRSKEKYKGHIQNQEWPFNS